MLNLVSLVKEMDVNNKDTLCLYVKYNYKYEVNQEILTPI